MFIADIFGFTPAAFKQIICNVWITQSRADRQPSLSVLLLLCFLPTLAMTAAASCFCSSIKTLSFINEIVLDHVINLIIYNLLIFSFQRFVIEVQHAHGKLQLENNDQISIVMVLIRLVGE